MIDEDENTMTIKIVARLDEHGGIQTVDVLASEDVGPMEGIYMLKLAEGGLLNG